MVRRATELKAFVTNKLQSEIITFRTEIEGEFFRQVSAVNFRMNTAEEKLAVLLKPATAIAPEPPKLSAMGGLAAAVPAQSAQTGDDPLEENDLPAERDDEETEDDQDEISLSNPY